MLNWASGNKHQNDSAELTCQAQTVHPTFEPEADATVFDGSSLRNVVISVSVRSLLSCEAMDGVCLQCTG